MAFFCTSGFMNAFGLFQEYYAQHQLSDMSAFDISWIGPFAMFMMLFGAGIAGVFVDRTGPTVSRSLNACRKHEVDPHRF